MRLSLFRYRVRKPPKPHQVAAVVLLLCAALWLLSMLCLVCCNSLLGEAFIGKRGGTAGAAPKCRSIYREFYEGAKDRDQISNHFKMYNAVSDSDFFTASGLR